MPTLTVLSPEFEVMPAPEAQLARRVELAGPVELAIIDNGKPNARELLMAIAGQLQARLPIRKITLHTKPTSSTPIDPRTARDLAARVHLIITGVGD
jgi:hypothetical protein